MKKFNTYQKVAKTFQAICFGVFALGVSMMIGDASGFYKWPFSTISITTTCFGVLGVVISELMCRQAASWAEGQ